MAETLAERRRKDEQVRETINQKLQESGEKDRCVLLSSLRTAVLVFVSVHLVLGVRVAVAVDDERRR